MHSMQTSRGQGGPGNGAPAGPAAQEGVAQETPGRINLADVVAQTACARMLGLMTGAVPLKLSRIARAEGDLVLRAMVVGAEYGERPPLQVAPASADALNVALGIARKE